MRIEEAIRILDPETSAEALIEIEYYGGFNGDKAKLEAVNEACKLAVEVLRTRQETRDSHTDTATCHYPVGMTIKPDGVHELDPCIYKVVEEHRNATVRVLQCERCGHIEVEWERQEDTTDEEV